MRIVILIPTYNERDNIGKLLRELSVLSDKIKNHRFTILIVDDNSPDGTGEIVKEYAKTHKNFFLLSGKKDGLGKAMIRGYVYALKNFKSDIVVTNEADFGFDFKYLPKMLEKIEEGFDVVVASRHVGQGGVNGWTMSRKLNHFIANTFFARIIAGVDEVYDKNGAFRVIRTNALRKINFRAIPTRGFAFFYYLIYELGRVTDKFYEVPAVFKFRTKGESKVSFNPKYLKSYLRDVKEYVKTAFQIRLKKLRLI